MLRKNKEPELTFLLLTKAQKAAGLFCYYQIYQHLGENSFYDSGQQRPLFLYEKE
ncbi:hypothetical protein SRA_00992 [Streptococcus ratti FA-1 = DSM 20564]|uniref:Uncharacterized protein n=1 Tax=Streptococcus ratti FA-1 = DSM 20564 TaxID=699248 RepID=A0ABP2R3F8_STRRT|nr:hypothetical protein SRA_00992 [Streptococcus ratti FA-1 = DSM 20564]